MIRRDPRPRCAIEVLRSARRAGRDDIEEPIAVPLPQPQPRRILIGNRIDTELSEHPFKFFLRKFPLRRPYGLRKRIGAAPQRDPKGPLVLKAKRLDDTADALVLRPFVLAESISVCLPVDGHPAAGDAPQPIRRQIAFRMCIEIALDLLIGGDDAQDAPLLPFPRTPFQETRRRCDQPFDVDLVGIEQQTDE